MKKRGINSSAKIFYSSPSPRPSPVKGEEVFLTFYDCIKGGHRKKSFSPHFRISHINQQQAQPTQGAAELSQAQKTLETITGRRDRHE
jgi:hypothetical protein